jgi:hypothetical protein
MLWKHYLPVITALSHTLLPLCRIIDEVSALPFVLLIFHDYGFCFSEQYTEPIVKLQKLPKIARNFLQLKISSICLHCNHIALDNAGIREIGGFAL